MFFVGIMSARLIRSNINSIKNEKKLIKQELENQKLIELDRMKSNFFTNISHEFRTPLTLILGPTNKLMSKVVEKEDVEDLKLIEKNANKILTMVNEILELSKLESNKLEKRALRGDIIFALKRIAEVFNSRTNLKNINYIKQFNVQSLETDFNNEHLEKVLLNLLSNAFKSSKNEGTVQFSVELLDNGNKISKENIKDSDSLALKIKVKDSGVGINENDIEKIFDRFYQADDFSGNNEIGTGIGLALVKEIVELYGGKIEVASTYGEGATFSVIWPLKKVYSIGDKKEMSDNENTSHSETMLIKNDEKEENEINLDKYLILIVEDDEDIRKHITSILVDEYDVIEAKNGKAGLDIAIEKIPDLIISDIMMPTMNGLEMCKLLKSRSKLTIFQ